MSADRFPGEEGDGIVRAYRSVSQDACPYARKVAAELSEPTFSPRPVLAGTSSAAASAATVPRGRVGTR